MSKKKDTYQDPLKELIRQCHAIGLNSYYELSCSYQTKKLGVNIFREETYHKFQGQLPNKILGFDVEYKFARKFHGVTYER